jgi:hypothetical protein
MSQIVPPLAAVLADFPDFRAPRGVRHPLLAVLLLSCVAMLCGARGESAIAEWAENYGETWRAPLGFTRPDGPSQSTVQRIFGGIDCDLLESRLGQWAARVIAHVPAPADAPLPFEAMAIDGKTLRGSAKCGNGLHYVKDVTLGEDRSLMHKGNGPSIMAVLRDTVVSVLHRAGWRTIAERLRC